MKPKKPLMKRGICPSCGSKDVHAGTQISFKSGGHGTNTIPINMSSQATLDNYVCVNCGYVESYIADVKALQKIAKEWPKIERVLHPVKGIRSRISPLMPGFYEIDNLPK